MRGVKGGHMEYAIIFLIPCCTVLGLTVIQQSRTIKWQDHVINEFKNSQPIPDNEVSG